MSQVLQYFGVVALTSILLGACSSPLSEQELITRASEALATGDVAAAEVDIKTALQGNPDGAQSRSLLGQVYLYRLEAGAAVAEFERALEFDSTPETEIWLVKALLQAGQSAEIASKREAGELLSVENNHEFQAVLARAYLIQGEFAEAREALDRSRDAASPYAETTHAIFAQQLENDPVLAREILERVVSEHPKESHAWSLLSALDYAAGDLESAIDLLGKSVAANPYRIMDRIQRVKLQIATGNAEDAEADLARLEKRMPNYPPVAFLRGQIYFNKQDYKNALQMFDRVLGVLPDDPGALLLAAHANVAQGNLETAQRQLSRFRANYPTHPQSGLLLGSILLQLGDASRAEELSREILQEQGMDIRALSLLAAALASQGLHAESAEYYAQVAELSPGSSAALSALGAQEIISGDAEAGISSLQSAVALEPTNSSRRERLIEAQLGSEDLDGASQSAMQYVEAIGGTRALVYLGRVLVRQEKLDEANDAFLQALEITPGDPMASANLAALFLFNGDAAGARKALEESLGSNPEDLSTIMRIAMVQEQQQDYEGMEVSLRRAMDASPAALSPRVALARLELGRNAPERAAVLLAPVDIASQDNPVVLELLVRSYLGTGDLTTAESFSRRLLNQQPDNPGVLALAGQVSNALGRYAVAEQQLTEALVRFSDNVALRKMLIESLVYQRKLDLAQVEVDKLPSEVRDEVPVVILRGRLALAMRDTTAATALFEDAFERAPSNTALVFLAGSKWTAGNQLQATADLARWLESNPEDVVVLVSLATYEMELERFDNARTLYTKIVGLQPKNVPALNNLAWLLKEMDTTAALAYIEQADTLAPAAAAIKDTYAMVELERGNFDRALSLNDMVLESAGNLPEYMFNRAQILLRSGNTDDARSLLEDLVAGPAFSYQTEARTLLESF